MKKAKTSAPVTEATAVAAVNSVPAEAPKPAAKSTTKKRPAPKRAAKPKTVAKKTAAPKAAASKPTAKAAPKAAARPAAKRPARPAKAAAKKATRKVAPKKVGAKAPASTKAKTGLKKAAKPRGAAKKLTKVDAKALVADALTAMKAVERTARRLLSEIHKREAEIAKLKGLIVNVNSDLKSERKSAKRQEKSAEKALLRAHAVVKRHSTRAKQAAAPVVKEPKVTFSTHMAKAPRKKAAKSTAAKKAVVKHAKHGKLAELGKHIASKVH